MGVMIAPLDCTSGAWADFLDSLDEMFYGVDSDGEAHVPDGDINWKLCVLFGKADSEQCCLGWGLRSYNDVDEMCGYCDANRTTRPFTNLHEDATWRPSERMLNALWMARVRRGHPLTDSKFFHKYFPRLDVMHAVDCNGLAAVIGGSILMTLVRTE